MSRQLTITIDGNELAATEGRFILGMISTL